MTARLHKAPLSPLSLRPGRRSSLASRVESCPSDLRQERNNAPPHAAVSGRVRGRVGQWVISHADRARAATATSAAMLGRGQRRCSTWSRWVSCSSRRVNPASTGPAKLSEFEGYVGRVRSSHILPPSFAAGGVDGCSPTLAPSWPTGTGSTSTATPSMHSSVNSTQPDTKPPAVAYGPPRPSSATWIPGSAPPCYASTTPNAIAPRRYAATAKTPCSYLDRKRT